MTPMNKRRAKVNNTLMSAAWDVGWIIDAYAGGLTGLDLDAVFRKVRRGESTIRISLLCLWIGVLCLPLLYTTLLYIGMSV